MRFPLCLLLIGLAAATFACSRNVEPFVEGEKPRQPDLSGIFPEPTEGIGETRTAAPGPAAAQAPGGGGSIRGTISLEPGAAARPGAILFVIARAAGSAGGPPMAVLRIPGAEFPQAFEIGQANVMIPNMPFGGDIQLTARLDGDGNAMTRDGGDLAGSAASAHQPGDTGVEIALR